MPFVLFPPYQMLNLIVTPYRAQLKQQQQAVQMMIYIKAMKIQHLFLIVQLIQLFIDKTIMLNLFNYNLPDHPIMLLLLSRRFKISINYILIQYLFINLK